MNIFSNKWKLLSFVLIGIIAIPMGIGLLAPPAYAPSDITQLTQQIRTIVLDIQAKLMSGVFGLQAIKNAVDGLDTSNLDAAVSTRASQTSVDAIADDLLLKKKFYFLSGSERVQADVNGFDGDRAEITINCGDVPAESCAFTVENIRIFETGLVGFTQLCDIFSFEIDNTVNPGPVFLINIFATGSPASDSNPLIDWGVGPVAASREFALSFECHATATDALDAMVFVEVVGEMPEGATMNIEMF